MNRVPTGIGEGVVFDFWAKVSTSSREMRPLGLEGVICSMLMPSSKARLRTAGAASTRRVGIDWFVGAGVDAGAAVWVLDTVEVAPVAGNARSPLVDGEGVSKTTSTSPTFAVCPFGTRIFETRPLTGAGISTMALSVSTLTTV